MRRHTGRGHGASKSSVLANSVWVLGPTLYSTELALGSQQRRRVMLSMSGTQPARRS
jgi:hypothetical protein